LQEWRSVLRAEELTALGLARREAETLAWVAAGKSDSEALPLGSSLPATPSAS